MNLRVLLLVGSAALNVVLLAALLIRPALAPAAVRSYFEMGQPAAVARPTAPLPRQPIVAKPAAPVWTALYSADLATLVARLRAAGFPPAMVRAVIDAEMERQFAPRLKELMRSMTDTPYWKPDMGYFASNPKLFEDLSQIYRERSRVARELLGKDAFAWGGMDPTEAQRRQFGNLSAAKITLVQQITDDYAEMAGQLRAATQGITLPEDREKFALLEREKHADLAAILTPEELADYEMRTSPLTMRLRTTLTVMDASEAEFRALYRIIEPFKDTLYPTLMSGSGMVFLATDSSKRGEATKQINEQVKAALGDARFADYQRAGDYDFQQLYRLGQRDNVRLETLVRAYDVRASTLDAAVKIFDNKALTDDAKREGLKNLAQSARTQLLSTLGPTTGPAYVDNSRWLPYLDQGRVLITNSDGGSMVRSLRPPTPAGTPPPKG